MELVTLWFFLTPISASLSATYIFKQGRYAMMCARCERPANSAIEPNSPVLAIGELPHPGTLHNILTIFLGVHHALVSCWNTH